jgi:hypothetical protein
VNLRPLSIAGLVALWAVALYGVATLPAQVPMSWDNDGQIRAMGSKFSILIMPMAGVFAFLVVTFAGKFAVYPSPAKGVIGKQLLAVVLAEVTCGFACIEAGIVASAASTHLSPVFALSVGVFPIVLMVTIAIFLIRYFMADRGSDRT